MRNLFYCIKLVSREHENEAGEDRIPDSNMVTVINYDKPVARYFNLPNHHSKEHMAVCGLSLHQGSTESRKTLEQKCVILTVSTNAFHSTNLFCCFSRYHAPTNSVAPSFCIYTTNNPQFLDSLRRRANARNVSFRISSRWPIYIINSVDKTKLSCNTPTDAAPQFL